MYNAAALADIEAAQHYEDLAAQAQEPYRQADFLARAVECRAIAKRKFRLSRGN
jgi:hypothetical protein